MTLESLLFKLNAGVTGVTGVTALILKEKNCSPADFRGVTGVTATKSDSCVNFSVTPPSVDTEKTAKLTLEPAEWLENRESRTAVEAVEALRLAGFAVTVKGDSLIVEPADELSEAQRGLIGKLSWAMVQLLSFGTLENLRKPTVSADPAYVCCASCRHSVLPPDTEPRYGWRSCGLDLPNGGGFAQQLRRCAEWEAAL